VQRLWLEGRLPRLEHRRRHRADGRRVLRQRGRRVAALLFELRSVVVTKRLAQPRLHAHARRVESACGRVERKLKAGCVDRQVARSAARPHDHTVGALAAAVLGGHGDRRRSRQRRRGVEKEAPAKLAALAAVAYAERVGGGGRG